MCYKHVDVYIPHVAMLTTKAAVATCSEQYTPAGSGGPRDKVLCEMIVAYYNGTDLDDSDLDAVKFFNGMGNHFRGVEGLVALLHIEFGPFDLPDHLFSSYPAAVAELSRHRPRFRAAVKWLCSRKEPDAVKAIPLEDAGILALPQGKEAPEEMRNALRLAIQEIRKLDAARKIPLSSEDVEHLHYLQEHGRNHVVKSLRLWGGRLVEVSSQPRHFIDLFCSFLLDKCIDKPPEELPVKLCPKCGKLFSSQPNKVYCSIGAKGCGYMKFWTPEKRAEDMYVRRLANYSTGDLRRKLDDLEVKARLGWIELCWPKESAIRANIRRIRARASTARQAKKEKGKTL
jgi:hypothetical protein